jgi:hypothetical protein
MIFEMNTVKTPGREKPCVARGERQIHPREMR